MKMLVSLLAAVAIVLPGCAVYTPSGAVVVDQPVAPASHGGGGFCPPGQAKKGRC